MEGALRITGVLHRASTVAELVEAADTLGFLPCCFGLLLPACDVKSDKAPACVRTSPRTVSHSLQLVRESGCTRVQLGHAHIVATAGKRTLTLTRPTARVVHSPTSQLWSVERWGMDFANLPEVGYTASNNTAQTKPTLSLKTRDR